MSAGTYNFDEIDNYGPTIIMGGHTFRLRYPTYEEMEKLQEVIEKEDGNKKLKEAIYGFVEKTVDKQPAFRDVIKKQNIKVSLKFIDMVKEEFGVEKITSE